MSSPVAFALESVAAARRLLRQEDGQDLVEYGLLMALIAIVAMGAVSALGNVVTNVFWTTIAGTNF
jgi:pilus assembly protein Flp/PilA